MTRFFLLLLLLTSPSFAAFTEFYVQNTGDNLNAGGKASADAGAIDDAASFTYAGGTFVRATGVFTVASGDPAADGVAAGDWVSIYTTAGATVANCVARVTARDATTITISATPALIVGAVANVSETAAAATARVGGAWDGPATTVGFPFNSVLTTGIDASNNTPRVNFLAQTYTVSAAVTHALNGVIRFQGYTTTPGDGGRATLQNATTGASYALLTISGTNVDIADFIFADTAWTSGASDGVAMSGVEAGVYRCVFHDFRRTGLIVSSGSGIVVECESYANNKNSSATQGGFFSSSNGGNKFIRCISHDNTTGTTSGFVTNVETTFIDCIADTNSGNGFLSSATTSGLFVGCDTYNNTLAGIDISSASLSVFAVMNCNLVNNRGWGINASGSLVLHGGSVVNCGFGAGTMDNDSGTIVTGLTGVNVTGTVTYANDVTPWVDPANGDFRINLAAAKDAGRGSFTQTAAGYAGTIGYEDIGAAHHITPAGGGQTSSASVK